MARTVAIGHQDYETVRENDYFYVDKTGFIKEWWEAGDIVTLITRPRRFGKTLTMSMTEKFFSVEYAGRSGLFEGMKIWEDEKFRGLQGTYPVISLSFSSVKETTCAEAKKKICRLIQLLYRRYSFLLEGGLFDEQEKEDFYKISADMEDYEASLSLRQLSGYLCRYYGRKVILLLDEYDTPMQEAYNGGYWNELTGFVRSLFNAAFKENPYLERALMTGITRVSKESIFSDLNNLEVVTSTSSKYAEAFGFTEREVEDALREYSLSDQKEEVKKWYDGFCFGEKKGIYNPWSIINFLDKKKVGPYWANTSSNALLGRMIRGGTPQIKESFEILMSGGVIETEIDEQIVYDQLDLNENAVWSLMLASGYLKVCRMRTEEKSGLWRQIYELAITDFEIKVMLNSMVREWFAASSSNYNGFIRALLAGDAEAMNAYMNRITLAVFSYFDTGRSTVSEEGPERFYHGFVLGLIVELEERYVITSNRESGFGRYDVMLRPRQKKDPAILLEFKVQSRKETDLEETAQAALDQIEKKQYAAVLSAEGIEADRIRRYGIAFRGKQVLIKTD